MTGTQGAGKRLPVKPSKEHLRKQAKRQAKQNKLGLAEAQRRLAAEYGCEDWASLMREVERTREGGDADAPGTQRASQPSPLSQAASRGDETAVIALLAEGHPVDGEPGERATPLWYVCASEAAAPARIAIAERLLAAGADFVRDRAGTTALQEAAARGPIALVELLIRRGALVWQQVAGVTALDSARRGRASDKAAIVELLDRPVIRDRAFRAAVDALHGGDQVALTALLDRHPRLLRDRAIEPDCYHDVNARVSYFTDPKLIWFIANNPNLVPKLPANLVELARIMIARGVDAADLDQTLMLVMTSMSSREQGFQIPLVRLLVEAGAKPTQQTLLTTLAHGELEPVGVLLEAGLPLTAPIAAALGRTEQLASLLATASGEERQTVLGLAVLNRQLQAVRMALDAGADPNGLLPVHEHSRPLHQAALDEQLELMQLLIERGARLDLRDTLWNGTPLNWAIHEGKPKARAYLESLTPPLPPDGEHTL